MTADAELLNVSVSFLFQADEPIADYAAMDDVYQGEGPADLHAAAETLACKR